MFFTERTVKINIGDFKSRIETCQKDCASLKDRFTIRVHVDTNIQVKEMKVDLGTLFFTCLSILFSNIFVVGTGRMMNTIKDEKLGAFELHSSI